MMIGNKYNIATDLCKISRPKINPPKKLIKNFSDFFIIKVKRIIWIEKKIDSVQKDEWNKIIVGSNDKKAIMYKEVLGG